MSEAKHKLDIAIQLLDELDTTPFGAVSDKLDRIANAVSAARSALTLNERTDVERST